jgi:uncharacterized membrane protein
MRSPARSDILGDDMLALLLVTVLAIGLGLGVDLPVLVFVVTAIVLQELWPKPQSASSRGVDARLGAIETWLTREYHRLLAGSEAATSAAQPAWQAGATATPRPATSPDASASPAPAAAQSGRWQTPAAGEGPAATFLRPMASTQAIAEPRRPIAAGPGVDPASAWRPQSAAISMSLSDFESLLEGRLLALVGGVALFAGALFFLSLAFSRGWIGPQGRVLLGLAGGLVAGAAGAWLLLRAAPPIDRRREVLAHVLLGVGLGTISLALFAATRLYSLVSAEAALAAILIVTIALAAIAVRTSSQLIAGYGLVAVLLAPPLFGAPTNLTTFLFVALVLIGTTSIALWRTWGWLPSAAFWLAAPQVGAWLLANPQTAMAIAGMSLFWGLNAVAAGGEEFRHRTQTLRLSSLTLTLSNAGFAAGAIFIVLSGDLVVWRGLALALLGISHIAIGLWFLREEHDRYPFGLVATATGLAFTTLAIGVQLSGPALPIGWAAEAAALAWVYGRRRVGAAGVASLVLAALSLLRLIAIEYPHAWPRPWEFAHIGSPGGETLALTFVLGAIAASALSVPERAVRIALAAVAGLLVAYVLPFYLDGLALAAGWSMIALVEVAAAHRVFSVERLFVAASWTATTIAEQGLYLAGALTAVVAGAYVFAEYLSPLHFVGGLFLPNFAQPLPPFTNEATLATLLILASAWGLAIILANVATRRFAMAVTIAALAWLLPFELDPAWSVAGWCGIAIVLIGLVEIDAGWRGVLRSGAMALIGWAALVALLLVVPPTRLVVDGDVVIQHPLLLSQATLTLAAIGAALGIAARTEANRERRQLAAMLAAGAVVYLLSVGVVDEIGGEGGRGPAFQETAKQAQVALSVLWTILGGLAFTGGLMARAPQLRRLGLGLFVLATLKVFVVDLGSLDVSYRVLSLVALGVLLLLSAYLYQRLRPPSEPAASPPSATNSERTASHDQSADQGVA